MIRNYPISGLLDGWYFRVQEVSNGCYRVEGSDAYGRIISRTTLGDPEITLNECVEDIRRMPEAGT